MGHFGSIERLMAATEKELIEVSGIGPKTARQIKQVLTSRPE